jgi:hypothetical protein
LATQDPNGKSYLAETLGGKSKSKNPADDVVLVLNRDAAIYRTLKEGLERSYSRFPVRYEENYMALLPHLAKLKAISMYGALKGVAELHAGERRQAYETVEFLLKLPNSLKTEPTEISQLVRVSMFRIGMQPLWEGIIDHRWTAGELTSFREMLDEYDLLNDLHWVIRADRTMTLELIDVMMQNRELWNNLFEVDYEEWLKKNVTERLVHWMPDGVYHRNKLFYSRLIQEEILPGSDGTIQDVDPEEIETRMQNAEEKLRTASVLYRPTRELFPQYNKMELKFTRGQSTVQLASVACALEQYYLKEGRYPKGLEELVPDYVQRLPKDVILGGDLIYHRLSDAEYELYSVGWNGTDDGGVAEMDGEKGDWVWKVVGRGKLE